MNSLQAPSKCDADSVPVLAFLHYIDVMQILDDWSTLQNKIDEALLNVERPIAAFDADHTLWNTDMGENFFQYIIDNKLVDLPDNPWQHYFDLRDGKNPAAGYLWLSQVLKGVPVATVREWNEKCVNGLGTLPTYSAQKRLIDYLHAKKVEVFVVTASAKWAVEAPAKYYNIQNENVIGVTTKVVDGIVSDEQDGPVTWKQGKVEGLLQKTNGVHPFLACGNSTGDIYLVNSATHIRLAVRSVEEGDRIFSSEESLQEEARLKNWLTHDFRK